MKDKKKTGRFFRLLVYRYIIKFPIIVFIVTFLGFTGLYFIVTATSTDVFKVFEGRIEVRGTDQVPVVRVPTDAATAALVKKDSRAFWYFSKQEKMYNITAIEVTNDEGETFVDLITAADGEPALEASIGATVSVDIAVGEQSLMARILNKGGK